MSIVDELTTDERTQYDKRNAQIYKFPVAEEKARDALMKQFLAEKDLPYIVKRALITKLFRLPSATLWAYRYVDDEKTLFLLSQVQPIGMHTAKLAAENRHFTWGIVRHMLVTNIHTNPKAMDVFIANLSDSVVTKEFAAELITVKSVARIASPKVIVERVRKAFDFDSSVPDSWIEEILKETEEILKETQEVSANA